MSLKTFLIKLTQINYFLLRLLESYNAESTGTRKDFDNWLRLVVLINYAGKSLCDEILHEKETLPRDGAKLYYELKKYKNDMHYQIHKDILCPSDEVIDESKFNLMIYAAIIHLKFEIKIKYKKLINDLRDMWNKIFHMKDVSTSTTKFEQLWSDASDMLERHSFDVKSLNILRTCDLYSVREHGGILEFLSLLFTGCFKKCTQCKISIIW